MAFESLRKNLAFSNRVVFLTHVGSLRHIEPEDVRAELVSDLARDVSLSLWAEPEKGERFRQILQIANLSPQSVEQIAPMLTDASPGVRNAAAAIFPPAHRPLLFGKGKALPPITDEPSAEILRGIRVRPRDDKFSSVAILASDDQVANRRMLESRQFGAVKFVDLDTFRASIQDASEFVAIMVDGSFLKLMPKEREQKTFLKELAEFSNFVWIRLHSDGLLLSDAEVNKVFRSVRGQRGATTNEQLSIQSDPLLKEGEVSHIVVAKEFLTSATEARFLPGELRPEETDVLIAAVSRYARDQIFGESFKLTSLTTKFMPEGRTPARIVMATINSSHVPVIAKVHEKPLILDELRRFNRYIRASDDRLRPEVSFHGSTGVILFGLIEDATDPFNPAPTLESCIRASWIYELYKHGKAQDLIGPINSAIHKLESLNRESCSGSEFESFSSPVNPAFREVENMGLAFHDDSAFVSIRKRAENIFLKLKVQAVVHGDVHLRNILVRGAGDAHLIDYAQSGPGHPAIDLVRLECALFATVFRAFGDEALLKKLQICLNTPESSIQSLPNSFNNLLRWKINAMAVEGAFACRDAAMRVLQRHGGSLEDYLAVKCLVGWTGLLLLDHQTYACRAIIEAITL